MFLMIGKPVWGSDRMKVSTEDATFDAQYHVNSAHTQLAGRMVDHHFRKNFASLSALRANVKISGYKGVKGAKDEVSLQWDGSEEDVQVLELGIETASHLVRGA
ncbi:MAG: hypothetical protein JKY37_00255 [Nannocystaceae bacterium]|nr:hypothetical protein [Nannocystaceae bacterium]